MKKKILDIQIDKNKKDSAQILNRELVKAVRGKDLRMVEKLIK